jgi:hypothetical protein
VSGSLLNSKKKKSDRLWSVTNLIIRRAPSLASSGAGTVKNVRFHDRTQTPVPPFAAASKPDSPQITSLQECQMITSHDETVFQDDCFGQERLFSNDGKPLDVGRPSTAIRKPLPLEDPIGGPLGRFGPRQVPGSWDNPFPGAPSCIAQPPIEVEVVPLTDGIPDLDQLLDKPVGVKDNSKDSRLKNLGSSARERRRPSKSFSRPRPRRKETSKYKDLPKGWSRRTYSDTTDDSDDHGSVFSGDDMSEEESVVPYPRSESKRARLGRDSAFGALTKQENDHTNRVSRRGGLVNPSRNYDKGKFASSASKVHTDSALRKDLGEPRRSPRIQYPLQIQDTKYSGVSFATFQDPVMAEIVKKWTNLEVGFPAKSSVAQPPLSGHNSTVVEPKWPKDPIETDKREASTERTSRSAVEKKSPC